jgi:hypothetical protein
MKKFPGAVLLVFLAALAMMSYSCSSGSSSSSGGGFANLDVQYTITGDRVSGNYNTSRTYTDVGAGTDYLELTWFCGNYKGQTHQTVKLTFKKVNNTWVPDSESFSGGSCG